MQGQIYISIFEFFEFLFARLRFQDGFKHYYSNYTYLSLSTYSTG